MAEINSQHEGPVFLASTGHTRVAIAHPYTGPADAPQRSEARPAERRRAARAKAKARKGEILAGAPWLRRLTTTGGAGVVEVGSGGGPRAREPGARGVGYP